VPATIYLLVLSQSGPPSLVFPPLLAFLDFAGLFSTIRPGGLFFSRTLEEYLVARIYVGAFVFPSLLMVFFPLLFEWWVLFALIFSSSSSRLCFDGPFGPFFFPTSAVLFFLYDGH